MPHVSSLANLFTFRANDDVAESPQMMAWWFEVAVTVGGPTAGITRKAAIARIATKIAAKTPRILGNLVFINTPIFSVFAECQPLYDTPFLNYIHVLHHLLYLEAY
ncbi:MAG: hypothetical protein WC514_02145 [Candidatus Paceibacterota bacterium]